MSTSLTKPLSSSDLVNSVHSPTPNPLSSLASNVEQVSQLVLPSSALSPIPLVGTQGAAYDFEAKIALAFQLKESDSPAALKLFSEIINKAMILGCPTEFAPGSDQFVNCLVGQFESHNYDNEHSKYNFVRAKIDELALETNLQDPAAINNIFDSLAKYLDRLVPFISKQDLQELRRIVTEARASASLQRIQVLRTPKSREVTPKDPSPESHQLREIFALIAFIALAILAVGLLNRHVTWFNSLSYNDNE